MDLAKSARVHRRLPVAFALFSAMLAMTMTGASATSPVPRSPVPVFVLDKGRFTAFDVPGGPSYFGVDITNAGQIAGTYNPGDAQRGFLRDKRGKFTWIDVPGAGTTLVLGINDHGQLVGNSCAVVPCTTGTRRGFLRDRSGRYTTIHVPGAVDTQTFSINNRGQIVGDYLDAAGRFHGYRWDKGRFTTFDGPAGAGGASLTDINDRGEMVGSFLDPTDPGTMDGFLLSKGIYSTFDAPDAPFTLAFGINNWGRIVGFTTTTELPINGEIHGFTLRRGGVGPFIRIDFPGAPQTAATGINDRDRIVGVYANPAAPPGGQPSPMPMPMMMSRR